MKCLVLKHDRYVERSIKHTTQRVIWEVIF